VRIRAVLPNLDYGLSPDNSPDKMQRLADNLQNIAYRMQALDIAYDRAAGHSIGFPNTLTNLNSQSHKALEMVFDHWAHLKSDNVFEQQRVRLQRVSQELEKQFDVLTGKRDQEGDMDTMILDLYSLLGCLRGLVRSMADTQDAINQIHWHQWSVARF
jgi:hypothetical protein